MLKRRRNLTNVNSVDSIKLVIVLIHEEEKMESGEKKDEVSLTGDETEDRSFMQQSALETESLYSIDSSERLTKFVRSIIVSVLSECTHELNILRNINSQNLNTNQGYKPIVYVSIEERYMGQENQADVRINSTNTNFDKLASDIGMIHDILKETCREIHFSGVYQTLDHSVKIIRKMYQDEEQLLQDEQNSEQIIGDLKNQCETERLENIRTIEDTDSKIQKLKFEVEDIYIYGKHEVEYFGKWEKARMEQNQMKCKGKENHFTSIIEDMTNKIDVENRCHLELVNFLEESKNDYLNEIQYWMTKYDEETDKLEADTINLRADLDQITEERKKLQATYEKRCADINDWLEYKRIKKEKEDRIALETFAATRIQAWWRGVMFRKKLGPYRKKKKGKGKGKDKRSKSKGSKKSKK